MKRVIISILSSCTLLSITSCGKPDSVPHEFDQWFQPLLDKYKEDADSHDIGYGDVDDITVFKFDNVYNYSNKPLVLAVCKYVNITDGFNHDIKSVFKFNFYLYHEVFYKIIVFDESIKNKTKDIQYELFLHEMGHCSYNLNHNHKIGSHIMAPVSYHINDKDWPNVLNEYFKDAKDNERNWFNHSLSED